MCPAHFVPEGQSLSTTQPQAPTDERQRPPFLFLAQSASAWHTQRLLEQMLPREAAVQWDDSPHSTQPPPVSQVRAQLLPAQSASERHHTQRPVLDAQSW